MKRFRRVGIRFCLITLAAALSPSPHAATASEPNDGIIGHSEPVALRDVHRRLNESDNGAAAVWIFFRDKGFPDLESRHAAIAGLESTYNPRAVKRRSLRRMREELFDFNDLPVEERYIQEIVATGAGVRVRSRWLNAVSADVDSAQLTAIMALPFVRKVQLVNRSADIPPIQIESVRALPDGGFHGLATDQLQLINLIAVHDQGFAGEGVIIGVLDTGFELRHDALTNPERPINIVAAYDFINDDPNVGFEFGDDSEQHEHGTIVLGAIAAYQPFELVGGAFDASFILCKTEDTTDEYQGEEDFYVAGLEFIEANGGDVATSSLGYIDWYTQQDLDGRTAVTTIAVNHATANGVYCVTAAGNSGNDQDPDTSHLIAPADAFDVITCGGVLSSLEIAGFSSDGPTADGRVKPELMSQGEIVYSIDPFSRTGYIEASGTSMATPQIAATVACLAQANPELTVEQMRERLFDAAAYFNLPRPDPLFVYGYGVANAFAASNLLALEPVSPGIAGELNDLRVSSATPSARVYFTYGFRSGSTAVPGCPGLSVDVSGAQLAGSAVADASGEAVLSLFVPDAARGRDVFTQAVEPANCRRSGARTTRFE